MADLVADTPRGLRGKYAIVGVGETGYSRGTDVTTRVHATRAIRAAINREERDRFLELLCEEGVAT